MRRLSLLSFILLGCSVPSGPPAGEAPDASRPQTETALRTVDAIAKVPAFAARIRAARPAPHLPSTADAPLRVDSGRPGVFVDVRSRDVAPIAFEAAANVRVYAGARPATDVVLLATGQVVEELRVLRTKDADPVAHWHLEPGPGVGSVRSRDGLVEVLDATGVVRIATERPFAVDAEGRRREVTFSLTRDDHGWQLTATLDPSGLVHPIVVDPAWQLAPTSLPTGGNAYQPVVHWLPSGKLFVTTGSTPSLFEPVSETWALGKPLSRSYNEPWGVPLSTGKILVSGAGITSPELWTEADGGVATGTMGVARGGTESTPVHVDAGLPTERVYVFGGSYGVGGTIHSSAERYDVATGTWSYVATMPAPRAGASIAKLQDGKILIAGGYASSTWYTSALVYDPGTDTYETLTSTLPVAHRRARVVSLDSGKVMFVGGDLPTGHPTETTTLFDPATKTFTAGPSMAWARRDFGVVPLAPGRFMVVGGDGRLAGSTDSNARLSSVEVFDAATGTWKLEPALTYARYRPATALLSGGRVLAAGGFGNVTGTNFSWEVLVPDPVPCTASSAGCACVDGFCCDKPCTGQCEACDTPSKQGICTPIVGEAPHGTRPACTPTLLCGVGGACAPTCSSDAACGATSWCTAGASCAPKKAKGAGCAAGNECTSGACVDGVCCDAACDGQCEACDVAGKVGTCSSVLGAPHGGRPACTGGAACDGAGACTTSCTSDAQCASTHFCDAGACVVKRAQGDLCGAASACATGSCVDGRCCDTACTGACDACDVAGKVGTCAPISGAPRSGKSCAPYATCTSGACSTTCASDDDCEAGAYCLSGACVAKKAAGAACGSAGECATGICASGVCCDEACTGECESCALAGKAGTCSPRPATEPCGLAGCVGAATVTRGTCSGVDSTCTLGTVTPCAGALKCADATSCKTSCTTGEDCVTGVCDAAKGVCAPSWDGGVPDADGGAIPVADAPAPTVPGKPGVGDFQRCTADAECSTGFCVEGVCCDSRCEDRCHSCALLESPGKCTLEPVGVDLKNECGPANACLGTCGPDGACIGSGAGSMCARNKCVGPTQGVGPAYCAGPGAKCPSADVVPFDCAPYVCEPAFGACRTSCATSAECANGFVCDVPSKTCVAAPSAPTDDSGCTIAAPGANHRAGRVELFSVALLALFAARRARARS